MYSDAKEAQCNHCDHMEVCSLTKEFIAAQKAVNNVTVGIGDCTTKDLRYFDWIKPVRLECVHFAPKQPTTRDISDENQARGIMPCGSEGKFMEDLT